jgi:hypothetical protein
MSDMPPYGFIHLFNGAYFALMRELFPTDERRLQRQYRGGDLWGRNRDWELTGIVLCPLGLVVAMCLCGSAMYGLSQLWTVQRPELVLALPPSRWAFMAVGFPLAIALMPWLVGGVYQLLLRERSQEFEDYGDWMAGFRSRPAFALTSSIFAGLGVLFFILVWDSYALIERDRLVWNDFLACREQSVPWADVVAVARLSHHADVNTGQKRPCPHVVLVLKDGRRWSTQAHCWSPEPSELDLLAQTFASQAQQPVLRAMTLAELQSQHREWPRRRS